MRKLILLGLAAIAMCGAAYAEDHHHGNMPHPPHNSAADAEALLTKALAAPDRPKSQTDRDANRHDEDMFWAKHIVAGQSVLDMGAGGGYLTMIASSIVGPTGHVDMQNPSQWVENYKLSDAIAYVTSKRANVTALTVDFDKIPVPTRPYDVVTSSMIYHDTTYMPVDRLVMNRSILAAMKPGGIYVIIDHRAEAGSGIRDASTIHRMEAQTIVDEVTAAGFVFLHDHDLLKNAEDNHTLNVFDPAIRGKTDRSILVFQKPMN